MAFDVDRRIAAARRRLHASIDARCEDEHVQTAIQVVDAYRAIHDRYVFLRRSAGQRRRYSTGPRKERQ